VRFVRWPQRIRTPKIGLVCSHRIPVVACLLVGCALCLGVCYVLHICICLSVCLSLESVSVYACLFSVFVSVCVCVCVSIWLSMFLSSVDMRQHARSCSFSALVHHLCLTHTQTGSTPLHLAAQYGHLECVRVLLSEPLCASVDLMNNEGQTPLTLATVHNHLDCVRLLLRTAANPKCPVGVR
jgi:Ankyrin repeats (3 copies)